MCTYLTIRTGKFQVLRFDDLSITIDEPIVQLVQNGFDYGEWPVVVFDEAASVLRVEWMEWGFVPSYIHSASMLKNMRQGFTDEKGYHPPLTMLNAIGEEMLEKTTFKKAASQRRCLVLASGFFEWRHLPKTGKKGQLLKATDKYPYHVFLPDADVFCMAGIWQPFTDKQTGETKNCFAIVTTAANTLMQQVHNNKKRMPVILSSEDSRRWVLPDLNEKEIKEIAGKQYDSKKMQAIPLSKNFRETGDLSAMHYEALPELTN